MRSSVLDPPDGNGIKRRDEDEPFTYLELSTLHSYFLLDRKSTLLSEECLVLFHPFFRLNFNPKLHPLTLRIE